MGATSMNLQRRRFLEGAGGALLTLPLFEANATETVMPPKRLVAAGTFYGWMPQLFHPKKVGREYDVPRLLKPLEHLRDEFTVFSGLDHNLAGGHQATKYFLTGIPSRKLALSKERTSPSIKKPLCMWVGRHGFLRCHSDARLILKTTSHGLAAVRRFVRSPACMLCSIRCFAILMREK